MENLSNYELLVLFRAAMGSAISRSDYQYVDQIQEEIYSRMEVEEAN